MTYSLYYEYEPCQFAHDSEENTAGFEMALCDQAYNQLHQWTYNRHFIIEVVRAIKMGLDNNPYRKRRINGQPFSISTFSMLQNVPKQDDDMPILRLAIREMNFSNRLFSFHVKRAIHYLNIFERAMNLQNTKCTLWLDLTQNIFFINADPRWADNPFMLDLFLHLVSMGDNVMIGQTIFSILKDITYGKHNMDDMFLMTLSEYRFHIAAICYSWEKYFHKKNFWRMSAGSHLYSDVFNLFQLVSGGLADSKRDHELCSVINEDVKLANDVPY